MTEGVQAAEVAGLLSGVGYLADEHACSVLRLAGQLGKPVLVEGPAGTGKTTLATSMAAATGSRLIRMQCYEGLDEARALYEWNHSRQLLRIMAGRTESWPEADVFTEEFLLTRPLLEVLSDYQVSIPELGTVVGGQVPAVFLTSNGARDLSEALRRRCLYLHLDYPPAEREREIVRTRVPGIPEHLAGQIAAFVGSLRRLDLRQHPSVTQTLEWARTLLALGAQDLDAGLAAGSLPVLLAYRSDIELAAAELGLSGCAGFAAEPRFWRAQQPRKPSTACMQRTSPGVPK